VVNGRQELQWASTEAGELHGFHSSSQAGLASSPVRTAFTGQLVTEPRVSPVGLASRSQLQGTLRQDDEKPVRHEDGRDTGSAIGVSDPSGAAARAPPPSGHSW